jgi:DNA-binding protein H-NS
MKGNAIAAMSMDKLWRLHEPVASILARKIAEEKARVEERLRRLQNLNSMMSSNRPRRPYPRLAEISEPKRPG